MSKQEAHNRPAPQAAKLRGVPVFNAPFSNTRSVAELTIAEVISLARQLGDRSRELHAGAWRKVSRGCHEVRGKTLGIVGYGHIGSQVQWLGPDNLSSGDRTNRLEYGRGHHGRIQQLATLLLLRAACGHLVQALMWLP